MATGSPRTPSCLFITDGNRSFPLHATTSLIYETPGNGNPKIVIVGIGYAVADDLRLEAIQGDVHAGSKPADIGRGLRLLYDLR